MFNVSSPSTLHQPHFLSVKSYSKLQRQGHWLAHAHSNAAIQAADWRLKSLALRIKRVKACVGRQFQQWGSRRMLADTLQIFFGLQSHKLNSTKSSYWGQISHSGITYIRRIEEQLPKCCRFRRLLQRQVGKYLSKMTHVQMTKYVLKVNVKNGFQTWASISLPPFWLK